MGNKGSQQSPQSSTNYRSASSYTANSRDNESGGVHYSSSSSLLNTRARCSQADCMKYQDEGNYLGFCVDCYRNYRRILFEDSSPPTLTISALHGSGSSSASSRTAQASQRSSLSGRQVTNGSSNYTSPYSYNSRTESGTTRTTGISQPRTTGTSSARTPGTTSTRAPGQTSTRPPGSTSTRTPGTTSTRTPGTTSTRAPGPTSTRAPVPTSTRSIGSSYLQTTYDPLGNYTTVHGTTSTRTPGISSTRTTGSSHLQTTYDPQSDCTVVRGTASTRTPGISSARTTGTTFASSTTSSTSSRSTYDPYTLTYGIASTTASGASSTRTEGGAYGSTSGLNVGSGVVTGSGVSTNAQVSTGARPKQYLLLSFPSQTSRSHSNLRSLMDVDVKPKKDETSANKKSNANTSASDSATTKTSKTSSKKDSQGMVVKTMRDNLLCPICLDLLNDAKTLPCQHVVCKSCLVQWVASKGELRCPTCNTRQTSPVGGVEGLPSNFTLNSLVAEMKKLDDEEEAETGSFDEEDEDDEEPVPITTPSITTSSASKPQTNFSSAYADWQQIPVAETSFLEILGKQFKVQGSIVKLRLQLCDVEGQPMRRDSKAGIEGSVCLPNGEKVTLTDISHRKKLGDFTVSFAAKMMGVHHVVVTLEEEEVVGSPAKIVVRPSGKLSHSLASFTLNAPKGIAALNSEDMYVTDESGFACTCIDSDDASSFLDRPDHKGCCQISPFGIAKSSNKLYITDSTNCCVYVYMDMECINNFGKRVLERPTGVVVSKDGTIYVADCGANSIDVFRANYSHERSIDLKGRGSVSHLALNQAENRILLADEKAKVIKIIDVNNGRMIKQIKTRINQAPATPFGIALDNEDNIFVSVTFDPTMVKSGKGAARNGDSRCRGAVITYNSNGYYLGTIGEKELINPRGICFVDPVAELFVLEAGDDGNDDGDDGACVKVFQL